MCTYLYYPTSTLTYITTCIYAWDIVIYCLNRCGEDRYYYLHNTILITQVIDSNTILHNIAIYWYIIDVHDTVSLVAYYPRQ